MRSGDSFGLRSAQLILAVAVLMLSGCLQQGAEAPTEEARLGSPGDAAREARVEGEEVDAPAPRDDGMPCAPGTRCLRVDRDGAPNPDGSSVAQCSGTFPDYIVEEELFPADYPGPWFFAASDFPTEPPAGDDLPWEAFEYWQDQAQADSYLYALRDYAFEGNIEIDFRVQGNDVRPWFTMPYMNYGPGRREMVHGVTKERTLRGPELGIKPGTKVENFAIGFYNAQGGFTTGQVWQQPMVPDFTKVQFEDGTMVFKILFSDATADDFSDPANYPLTGAPEWHIAADGGLRTVRLMQMDVAARDPRAEPGGWVFGTFAFDKDADDENPWNRLRPVGLQWGNAPGYTPQDQADGKPLPENIVSDEIPAYALAHLGWAGRVNGPVDNPRSACISCHSTAQYPVDAGMLPSSSCTTEQKLHWFRNLPSTEAFGAMDGCEPESMDPPPVALDFSLQMQVAMQSILQYDDINPCLDPTDIEPADDAARRSLPRRSTDAPRVGRGGFMESEEAD